MGEKEGLIARLAELHLAAKEPKRDYSLLQETNATIEALERERVLVDISTNLDTKRTFEIRNKKDYNSSNQMPYGEHYRFLRSEDASLYASRLEEKDRREYEVKMIEKKSLSSEALASMRKCQDELDSLKRLRLLR